MFRWCCSFLTTFVLMITFSPAPECVEIDLLESSFSTPAAASETHTGCGPNLFTFLERSRGCTVTTAKDRVGVSRPMPMHRKGRLNQHFGGYNIVHPRTRALMDQRQIRRHQHCLSLGLSAAFSFIPYASSFVLGAFSLLRRTARTALLATPDCSSGAQ